MDGFKGKLKSSIQVRLSFWISVAIVAVGLVGGILSFGLAFSEATDMQDDLLRQMSWMFERHRLSPAAIGSAPAGRPEDSDATVIVRLLDGRGGAPADAEGPAFPPGLKDGLQTVNLGELPYRVLVRTLAGGQRVAFAQQTDFRDDLSTDGALRTLMPFPLLAVVLLVLVARLVRQQFRPVAELAAEIGTRAEGDLHPLTAQAVPAEVRPFVAAINQLLERVAQAMETQRRFIADAAHELRSPLTALSLQAGRMEAAEMPASTRELLGPLKRGINRGRALLEQLLTYARVQSTAPARAELSLQTTYRRVLEDLMPLAEAKTIDIGVKPGHDAAVVADQVELSTVVMNLVTNAIRYTPAGGRVDLWVEEEADVVVMQIEDSGPGIPESERARVFDPFYRILGSEQTGSGLGLAIVKTIVERLRGEVRLSASSLAPTGLRVSVRLPLRPT